MNHLRDLVLQLIFDSCCTEKGKIALELTVDFFQLFILLLKVLLCLTDLEMELLDLFLSQDLHSKVKRAQALL